MGKGKKKDVMSSFLMGLRCEDGLIKPISKVGTGFSDQFLQQITNQKNMWSKNKPPHFTVNNLKPDFFY